MDHANNAVYADWLDERVIAAGEAGAGRDPGAAAARPPRVRPRRGAGDDGDRPALRPTGRRLVVRLTDPAGDDLLRARLEPVAGP